jgi:hypothetical protein
MRTATATATRPRGRWSTLASIGAATALAVTPVGVAAARDASDARGIDRACHERAQQADQFEDVSPEHAHAGAIACLWVYNVVQGRFVDGANVYEPHRSVTRQQMASFVASHLDVILDRFHQLPSADPEDVEDRFTDGHRVSAAHARNVVRLHEAGIVQGYADGTFRPTRDIDRAQMATFVVHAIEDVTGQALPRTASFDDIEGNAHEANIEKLASIGVTAGRTADRYAPHASTTRAQMAAFVARTLDYFVDEGFLQRADFARHSETAQLYVDRVDTGAHDGFDRATFHLTGDGAPGWVANYVDGAVAQGSGETVEVAGDAILEVMMTGAAYPDPEAEHWNERVTVEGDGIVDIVPGPIYEGRQQLWIGTTAMNGFSVERLEGRFYVDVDQTS